VSVTVQRSSGSCGTQAASRQESTEIGLRSSAAHPAARCAIRTNSPVSLHVRDAARRTWAALVTRSICRAVRSGERANREHWRLRPGPAPTVIGQGCGQLRTRRGTRLGAVGGLKGVPGRAARESGWRSLSPGHGSGYW